MLKLKKAGIFFSYPFTFTHIDPSDNLLGLDNDSNTLTACSDTLSAGSDTLNVDSDTLSAHSDPETCDAQYEIEIYSEQDNLQ